MSKKHLDSSLKKHIINMYERDYEINNIAEIYQVTDRTIYNIINKYKNDDNLERKKGSGKKLNQYKWHLIKNIVDDNHNLSLSQISTLLMKKFFLV